MRGMERHPDSQSQRMTVFQAESQFLNVAASDEGEEEQGKGHTLKDDPHLPA